MPAPDYAQTIAPFTFPAIGNTAPSYENIIKMLSGPQATESQFIPELQQILSQRSTYLEPAIAGIQAQGQRGQADLMGAFAKRGLTGGSIEAQGLATQQGQVNANVSEMLGRFALENSQFFANLLSRARAGDVQAQRSMMQMIAEAMGQELTGQRDERMFGRQMAFAGEQARKSRESQMWASLIQGAGAVGAGALIGMSDRRLKTNIKRVGEAGGLGVYSWTWGKEAEHFGLKVGGKARGVMADEVMEVMPWAVICVGGFFAVKYGELPADVRAVVSGV